MNRREFNTLLSLGTVAQVAGPAIASTPVPGTRKWYETLTPGIHLDYHYPEWDPFLASKADGAAMIRKMAETNAKMVVVFAKCHYGNAYYNTRAGHKHKNLGDKDLLREWVTEARRQKLTVLVYYSVDRDVWAGKEHSAWRMKDAEGALVDEDRYPPEWAAMGFLCYNSPYRDLVKQQVEEILEYDIDGFHFDMLWFGHSGKVCYCEYCRPLFKKEYGIEMPVEPVWNDAWRKFLQFRYDSNARFCEELSQVYVQLGNLEKYHAAFRAGRQELAFGDERLIGSSNFTNVARSFDGYRAMFQQGKFRLDAFAASVVALVDGQVGGHTPGNYIDGLYGQLQDVIPHATLQPYFLWRRSPSQKMENGGLANEHFGTTGFRLVGKLPLGFDYNSEMAIQRGSLGADRIASWASHLSMGYKIPRFTGPATRYIFEYNFAGGDGNAKDGVHGTFDQLYATSHDKLDLADQVGWKNVQHFRTGPEFIISRRLSSGIKYSDYWLANAHDALYNASGAVVARSANGSAGRWVGQEFDGTLVYSLTRTSQFGGGFGYLLPGTFLKLTTPGRAYSYPYLYYSTSF